MGRFDWFVFKSFEKRAVKRPVAFNKKQKLQPAPSFMAVSMSLAVASPRNNNDMNLSAIELNSQQDW